MNLFDKKICYIYICITFGYLLLSRIGHTYTMDTFRRNIEFVETIYDFRYLNI